MRPRTNISLFLEYQIQDFVSFFWTPFIKRWDMAIVQHFEQKYRSLIFSCSFSRKCGPSNLSALPHIALVSVHIHQCKWKDLQVVLIHRPIYSSLPSIQRIFVSYIYASQTNIISQLKNIHLLSRSFHLLIVDEFCTWKKVHEKVFRSTKVSKRRRHAHKSLFYMGGCNSVGATLLLSPVRKMESNSFEPFDRNDTLKV